MRRLKKSAFDDHYMAADDGQGRAKVEGSAEKSSFLVEGRIRERGRERIEGGGKDRWPPEVEDTGRGSER